MTREEQLQAWRTEARNLVARMCEGVSVIGNSELQTLARKSAEDVADFLSLALGESPEFLVRDRALYQAQHGMNPQPQS